ncbi:unnamed protein product [Cuscuta europaea]|uniref:Uncharacterized protein n=1 Tax=Cuscuta europaea TaxID=41803 RepID=A0A9P0ZVT4_CUSEU|nr:unnamed protein product [Cuscuta europaea]
MTKKMVESQNWTKTIRDCLSRLEAWSCKGDFDSEKVQMELVDNLLSLSLVHCVDPAYLKLKEIDYVLLLCPKISVVESENVQSKILDSPISAKESEKLIYMLSSVKRFANSEPFSSEEIDEVRTRWASYFLEMTQSINDT